jgi:hypothetical protein
MSEDDTATAALLEFLNASEAGIIAAKHLIMEAKGVAEEHSWLWDPSKIRWQQTQGSSGPYEKSEDVNSLNFKTMLKDLATHEGRLSRDGYFYWLFKNGSTVGRKKR